ncbi:transcription-repair coupling factor [Thermaerobacillus caldiproteolyticus]|uniref:Transcription-repair-coupling factor n=1 Tax=Thermaerobacillus caldiproteolyticus TaxID=247480 RepID=A0A7V9Z9U1_9BACL|nr:transcription-repair coupling factor [Anoxybacillus caldiproteolyticus]MBA2876709.1 transcription-repair coupling factor (superfamily II helicase) [Anoxybacillus caldiproteolyticus]
MLSLHRYFVENQDIQSIIKGVEAGLKEQLVAGLSGSARSVFLSSLYKATARPLLIVTHNLFQAQKIYDDLIQLLSTEEVFLYPVNEMIAAEMAIASPELKAQRLEVMNYWTEQQKGIVISPIAGLRRLLPPKSLWKDNILTIEVNSDIDVDHYKKRLVQMGYKRVSMVSTPGEFSIRGGILDIYPLTAEFPYRIELFDTEVESIRTFTIDDQRSREEVQKITIGPADEIIVYGDSLKRGIERIEAGLSESLKTLKDEKAKQLLLEHISFELEQLKQGQEIEQQYKYSALFYDEPASLLDYMPDNGLLLLDEMSRLQEMTESLDKEEAEWYTSLLAEGKIIHGVPISHSLSELLQKQKAPRIYLSLFLRHVPHTHPQNIVNISCKQMQNFHGQMSLLKSEVERWKRAKYAVAFLAPDAERMKKLQSTLEDYEIDVVPLGDHAMLMHGKCQIVLGDLNTGFELPMQKLAVITEEELFKKRVKKPIRRQKLSNAERIKSYSELQVGDYVVHVNHGIGKYLGIETLEINGIHKDYIHIQYQGSDTLYVPVDQIDQVQKYVGSEGKEPKIYKLGGTEWKKVKKKVESSVQDIAEDLIKLYAEREASKGYAFSPDTEMQREFEAAFPYQETEDQLRSIEEIKRDMESQRPMDRLLCGDVGYGKTEVALRAAFKAIMDGKQVALLVPTTILAQQHYETVRERFQGYPIKVEVLNRFRTKKQQAETIKGLKDGTIDMVIGTHRLLSKDVTFKDLGLLIIDEEQRFGVSHKEKIKQLKTNIDVLTLTATPIPRTLHMSMIGVRDLSIIETPPENRFPVQTYVMEYTPELVREAIERELARDGQVFFLYNRIEDIDVKAEEISMLVPDARVTYAHGRMSENELESVMLAFLEGQYDVLVTTTIIETGVDIPNVNTLIVHDADRMGLSQLYQLRGRVGRSNRVAYAYFTYRKDKVLNEVAEKRLQAIKEFTELGSGFKIAMRDLSIRGAGNLLGAEQHGFIDSVGFDLYSQMLKEAIEKRKGIKQEEKPLDVEIDLEVDAYIPDTYVSDGLQKIDMYKRFKAIETIEDLEELRDEMIDRFGEYPDEVAYLFQIAEIKVYSKQSGIELIKQHKQQIDLLFNEKASKEVQIQRLSKIGDRYGRVFGFGMEGPKLKIVLYIKGLKPQEWLMILYETVKELTHINAEKSITA